MVFERKLNFATAKISIFFSQNVGGRDYVFFLTFFHGSPLCEWIKICMFAPSFIVKEKARKKNKSMSNQNVLL